MPQPRREKPGGRKPGRGVSTSDQSSAVGPSDAVPPSRGSKVIKPGSGPVSGAGARIGKAVVSVPPGRGSKVTMPGGVESASGASRIAIWSSGAAISHVETAGGGQGSGRPEA